MELIDVPHFGWKPENSVLGLSAFVDFEITGFAFFRTEFRVDRVLPIWYRKKNTFLPHSNNLHIYSQPGGSYIYKVLFNCDVILRVPLTESLLESDSSSWSESVHTSRFRTRFTENGFSAL